MAGSLPPIGLAFAILKGAFVHMDEMLCTEEVAKVRCARSNLAAALDQFDSSLLECRNDILKARMNRRSGELVRESRILLALNIEL